VLAGEDSLRGALREAKEEVGIDLDPEKGKLLFTMKRDVINGRPFRDFVDVWLFDYDGELDLAKAETKEVAEVKWMTREEIRTLDEAGVFVPTLRYFFDCVP